MKIGNKKLLEVDWDENFLLCSKNVLICTALSINKCYCPATGGCNSYP